MSAVPTTGGRGDQPTTVDGTSSEWLLIAAASLTAARVASGRGRGRTSRVQALVAALSALGAIAAVIQIRPLLPPGGLKIAAGLVFLEMCVHTVLDGLRRAPGESWGRVPDPGVLLEAGESAAAITLLAAVAQQPVRMAVALAAGIVIGTIMPRRRDPRRYRWSALVFAAGFLGTSALLLFGTSR